MSEIAKLQPEVRSQNLYHHIDPGFINQRKVFSAFGTQLMLDFERYRKPPDDDMADVHNNHMLVDLVLTACREHQVPSLGELLREPKEGRLFASTENLAGTKDVYKMERARNRVLLPYQKRPRVVLEFSTKYIQNDTGRIEQSSKNIVTVIGQVRAVSADEIVLAPLVMGAPSFEHPLNANAGLPLWELAFRGWEWYETLPEDIDEFAKMKDIAVGHLDEWVGPMHQVTESAVKAAICELLADNRQKDWGGEECDHFSAHVHI
jgi:hypothetical protein